MANAASAWLTTGWRASRPRPASSWSPAPFYDEILAVSSKTTFDAVTHALMTTPLTDAAGAQLAGLPDALALIDRVESIRGQVPGAPGDHQFRLYVRLVPSALDTLARSREFKRGVANTIFHKGYPTNYRAQGGHALDSNLDCA